MLKILILGVLALTFSMSLIADPNNSDDRVMSDESRLRDYESQLAYLYEKQEETLTIQGIGAGSAIGGVASFKAFQNLNPHLFKGVFKGWCWRTFLNIGMVGSYVAVPAGLGAAIVPFAARPSLSDEIADLKNKIETLKKKIEYNKAKYPERYPSR